MNGSYLRILRQEHGHLSLSKFARLVGLTTGYLSVIERDKKKVTDTILEAYERGLGLTPGSLKYVIQKQQDTGVMGLLHEVWVRPLGDGLDTALPASISAEGARVPLITGVQNVQLQACALLDSAAHERRQTKQTDSILIASNSSVDALAVAQDLQELWLSTLAKVLQRGWRVVHLWVLAGEVDQTISLIEKMFPLLGQNGEYKPVYYSIEQYKLPAPLGIVLVPGQGAMLLFGANQSVHFDTAFSFLDSEAISSIQGYFHRLSAGARPLLNVYQAKSVDFDYELANADNQEGERCMIKDGFSNIMLPESVYQTRAQYLSKLEVVKGKVLDRATRLKYKHCLDYRMGRIYSFEKHVATGAVRHIASKQAIERMLQDGYFARDDWLMNEDWARLTPEEAADCVHNVIRLLRTHPKFELGLVDENEFREHLRVFWTAVGTHSVLLEAWRENENGEREESDLVLSEPLVVTAFQAHFARIWDGIQPSARERDSVIRWLERQLSSH
jgi:hypothetical protein